MMLVNAAASLSWLSATISPSLGSLKVHEPALTSNQKRSRECFPGAQNPKTHPRRDVCASHRLRTSQPNVDLRHRWGDHHDNCPAFWDDGEERVSCISCTRRGNRFTEYCGQAELIAPASDGARSKLDKLQLRQKFLRLLNRLLARWLVTTRILMLQQIGG